MSAQRPIRPVPVALALILLTSSFVFAPGLVRAGSAGATEEPVDRAAIERLLAQPSIPPTGEVRRFELIVSEIDWELLPGTTARAIAFNSSVPGPTIRITEGDDTQIVVRNGSPEPTSVHWHGLHVPNEQDGVAGVTQAAIAPGESFTYRFRAPHAGTFMYHAHGDRSREQIDRGLYGALIIDPQGDDPIRPDHEVVLALQGWMVGHGMASMGMGMGMDYDHFTINGRAFPATEPIEVGLGELVRLRFINPSQTIHPMHLHGMDMAVLAKDGEALAHPQRLNTLTVAQGETYDVVFVAAAPGVWLLHCHDLHHVANAGQEPGGLIMVIDVRGEEA